MARTTSAHVNAAERLLAHEGGSANARLDEQAAAPGRVYERIFHRLAPLIGKDGVRALFARSVKLTKAEFPSLAEIRITADRTETDGAVARQLVECLSKLEPAEGSRVASALYANFLRLLTDFIGERLVWQVLRRAFPQLDQGLPKEKE